MDRWIVLSDCRCISDSLSGIFGFQLLAYVGENLVEGDNPQLVVQVEALGGTIDTPPTLIALAPTVLFALDFFFIRAV